MLGEDMSWLWMNWPFLIISGSGTSGSGTLFLTATLQTAEDTGMDKSDPLPALSSMVAISHPWLFNYTLVKVK